MAEPTGTSVAGNQISSAQATPRPTAVETPLPAVTSGDRGDQRREDIFANQRQRQTCTQHRREQLVVVDLSEAGAQS